MGDREELVRAAHSLFDRSLTHGSTGNLSMRNTDNILVTPTGSSLGAVQPDDLSVIDVDGSHIDGPPPSKEAFLHAAMYRARPQARAIVHTHSTHCVAVSCLAGLDPDDALPPLTAYFAMRIGRIPLLPYFAPGDPGLKPAAELAARDRSSLLLRNHGPIVAKGSISQAVDALEELEETAKIFLLLRGSASVPLSDDERARLSTPD